MNEEINLDDVTPATTDSVSTTLQTGTLEEVIDLTATTPSVNELVDVFLEDGELPIIPPPAATTDTSPHTTPTGTGTGGDRRKQHKQQQRLIEQVNRTNSHGIHINAKSYRAMFDTDTHASITREHHKLYEYTGQTRLKTMQINRLVVSTLTPYILPTQPVQWYTINHRPLITSICMIVCDGLNYHTYTQFADHLTTLHTLHEQPIETHIKSSQHSSNSVITDYMTVMLTKDSTKRNSTKKQKTDHTPPPSSPAVSNGSAPANRPNAWYYVLSADEQKLHKYPSESDCKMMLEYDSSPNIQPVVSTATSQLAVPLLDSITADDNVNNTALASNETAANGNGHQTTHINNIESNNKFAALADESDSPSITLPITTKPVLYGVDCEMCYTCNGLECTRVTLVDQDHKVLLDELVKPAQPIVNYNTQYSGITEEMLAGVTTTVQQVRQRVLDLLTPAHNTQLTESDTVILCGHSLDNDMRALRLYYPYVLDTTVMYPHPNGLPLKSALRYLAMTYLDRSIQNSSTAGHDPREDAIAALELTQLKIQHGPTFGLQARYNSSLSKQKERYDATKVCDILSEHDVTVHCIGRNDAVKRVSSVSSHSTATYTDSDAVKRACKVLSAHKITSECAGSTADTKDKKLFVLCQLHDMAMHMNSLRNNEAVDVEHVKLVNSQIQQLITACTPNTLIMVLSGQSAVNRLHPLTLKKIASANQPGAVQWTEQDDLLMKEYTDELMHGVAFVHVKT